MLRALISLLFCGTLFCVRCQEIPGRRIVNGQQARPGQFPYFVQIQSFETPELAKYCGGAILSPTKVLTAAHCVRKIGSYEPVHRVFLRTGSIERLNGTLYEAESWHLRRDVDLAIVSVSPGIELTRNVGPIGVGNQPVAAGEKCIVMGFGETMAQKTPFLQFASLTVNPIEDIRRFASLHQASLFPNAIYAGLADGKSACSGDSGAPLVCHGEVVGVVSGSIVRGRCGEGVPSAFSDVFPFREWIGPTFP